jgi:hypothetical protein
MHLTQGGSPFDWFFLAMCHWQMRNHHEARKWYTQAIDRMEKIKSEDRELQQFRAEAENLLGITDGRMPNGSDAFQ